MVENFIKNFDQKFKDFVERLNPFLKCPVCGLELTVLEKLSGHCMICKCDLYKPEYTKKEDGECYGLSKSNSKY